VRDPPALRPACTPTDQAWIESLFGDVKAEWPHLLAIRAIRRCCAPSSPWSVSAATACGCPPGLAT
jgi:hypothetical protein